MQQQNRGGRGRGRRRPDESYKGNGGEKELLLGPAPIFYDVRKGRGDSGGDTGNRTEPILIRQKKPDINEGWESEVSRGPLLFFVSLVV